MDTIKIPSLKDLVTTPKSQLCGIKQLRYDLLFSLDDTVYWMNDNKIATGFIREVDIKITTSQGYVQCIYTVQPTSHNDSSIFKSNGGTSLFSSKQELLDSL